MKRSVWAGCMVMFLTAACFGGVTVTEPANGSSVASPVHVVAYGSSDVFAMKLYVDGVGVYAANSAKIDTYVSLSAGSHSVTAQGWSTTGAIYKTPFSISVSLTPSSGVTMTSPANGITVGSPVHVVAAGSADVYALKIYVDHQLAYSVSGPKVDTYLPLAAGGHHVVAQGWSTSGAIYKTPVDINVGSTGSDAYVPPPASRTYANIDQVAGWESCGACAGINGSGPVGTYWMKQFVSSPSMDGQSAQFYVGGKAWANALWWKQLGANSAASHFVYDLYFYLNSPGNAQALEFDVNQSVNGKKYIFGTQCAVVDGQWEVWDTAGAYWVKTGISCTAPPAYTWNHLTLEFQRANGQTLFVAVTLNGVKKYINRAYNTKAVNASELNVAFQMDLKGAGAAYTTWLDKVQLTAW